MVEQCVRCRVVEQFHDVDFSRVDAFGDIAGDEQLCLVWCASCQAYEWTWLDRELVFALYAEPEAA